MIVYVVLPQGSVIQNADDVEHALSSLVPPGALNCVTPISAEQQKKNRDLLDAAERNDVDEMRRLLQNGADVATIDDRNYMPIHCVARNGSVEGLEELLKAKTPLGVPAEEHGEMPLHAAISNGRDAFISVFFKSLSPEQLRPLLGYSEGGNYTALSVAAHDGHRAIVEMMLPFMTLEQIQIQSSGGMAIHLAAQNGHADIVELLLRHLTTQLKMSKDAISKMLKNSNHPAFFTQWMERTRKFPDCVRILKPYISEL